MMTVTRALMLLACVGLAGGAAATSAQDAASSGAVTITLVRWPFT
jgi:hypothetical protein